MADVLLPKAKRDPAAVCGRQRWLGYFLAIAATALATLLHWGLAEAFGQLPPFITFYPAVALTAMLLGARAGVLATVLSAVTADFLFLPPHRSLAIVSLNHVVTVGLFTANGLLICWMAALLNRARLYQIASEREALLHALSEGVPDPMFLKDRDSRMVIVNTATVRAIGKPAERIVGHTDADFYDDPAVAQAMMANDRRVMESGQPATMEEFVPSPEGPRTFLSIKTPWRDAQGQIIGIIGCARDISEHKRAEEALRQSERRYRTTFDNAAMGIVEVDDQLRFITVNNRARQILGYRPGELLGMTVHELTHPEDQARSDELNAQLHDGRVDQFDCEKRYRKQDGSPVWIHMTVSAIRDSAGRFTRGVGTLEDISERKHAEEALRQSESRLRAFFEQAAVGTAVADPATGRFTQANAKYCEMTGYELPELLNMTIWNVTHPQDRVVDQDRYDRLVTGAAKEYLAEKRYVRKDGRVIWVQVAVGMVRDDQGRAVQSVGVIQDITERKRAEEALRQSEAGLAAAQRLAHVGSWQWDVQNDTALWSDETFRIFGLAHDQLKQHRKGFVEMLHPEDRRRVDQALTEALSGTRNYDLDYRIQRQDGSEKIIHTQAEVLRDGDGKPVMMQGTVHDITERKRAEQELRRINQTLEQRVAEQTVEVRRRADQLQALAVQLARSEQQERRRLAQVLHDHLQQLLVAAKFNLRALQTQPLQEHLRQAALRIDGLLDESIGVSRSLTAELCPPVLYKGTFAAALHWLADWMRDKHGLQVQVQADEQVNPTAEETRVLLFQAVRELLFNVAKHARVDRAAVRMQGGEANTIRILVADDGAGFDPRQRSSPAAGTGLGLFGITERLELLGGRLEIDSTPGQGTRMTIVSPLNLSTRSQADGMLAAPTISGQSPETPPPDGNVGKIRVLLADDHAVMRDGLSRLLHTQPDMHVAAQACDGREAVDLALALRPDVVVMDVTMPNLDGVEATRRIVRELPDIHVIGLSMHADQDVAKEMAGAGAASYLPKTSPPETLLAAIRQCAQKAPVLPPSNSVTST